MPTQMAGWEGATGYGVDLHVACAPFDHHRQTPTTKPPASLVVHRLEPRGWVARGHLWWIYPGLSRLIKDIKPDLIHVTAEAYGLFYSQLNFDRYPITGHTADMTWTQGGKLERTIRLHRARSILPRLSGLAAWNKRGLELGLQYGLRPDVPTAVVPARMPSPWGFMDAATERLLHRGEFGFTEECVIGYLGRLVPVKGVDWLLQSFAKSVARDSARLVIFGSGPMEEEWKNLARSLSVDVTWFGAVPPEDVPGVLASLDLVVVPSVTLRDSVEQFGRVIVEAMFAGTPVVASTSGSIPEVVSDAGVLVQEGDIDALSRVLGDLVSDPARRVALGAAGRKSALARYRPEVIGNTLARFWELSASRRRGKS